MQDDVLDGGGRIAKTIGALQEGAYATMALSRCANAAFAVGGVRHSISRYSSHDWRQVETARLSLPLTSACCSLPT